MFDRLIEERIRKAYEEKAFENIEGMGQPLKRDKFEHVPENLRMAYRMMHNAGYTEEEQRHRQDIYHIEKLLAACTNPKEEDELKNQLNQKRLNYQRFLSGRKKQKSHANIFKQYETKVEKRLVDDE